MSEFKIDFFELAFLAEACIPPVPIARASFFNNLSDIYYAQMSQDERNRLFEWILPKLDLSNEDSIHFVKRFEIWNQYKVYFKPNHIHSYRKGDFILAYKYNDKYHTSRNQWIEEKYIESVSSITEP